MNDKTTSVETLKEMIRSFCEERDWAKFQSPKNLSMCITTEAAELMEFFLWTETAESKKVLEDRREEIEREVADIAAYLFSLCSHYNIDLSSAFKKKMELNAQKYPIDKVKGIWTKYSDL